MDGYAVRAEDTFGAGRYDSRTLECVGKVFTGQVPSRSVRTGQCVEIATGAPMPDGADAVVMVEETERVDGTGESVSSRRSIRGRTSGAWRGHRRRSGGRCSRATADPEPRRRAGRNRSGWNVDVYARPEDRDPVDRQRNRRAGPPARTRADLRHQSVHAFVDRRRRTGACRSLQPTARTRSRHCRAPLMLRWRKTCSSFRAAAPSASATSSSTC